MGNVLFSPSFFSRGGRKVPGEAEQGGLVGINQSPSFLTLGGRSESSPLPSSLWGLRPGNAPLRRNAHSQEGRGGGGRGCAPPLFASQPQVQRGEKKKKQKKNNNKKNVNAPTGGVCRSKLAAWRRCHMWGLATVATHKAA